MTTTERDTTTVVLRAPVAGRVIPLAQVSDPAFAAGALGPGAAIEPSGTTIVAPADGTLVVAMPHAYGLLTDEGVEVLVHIGIDTVRLEGRHFDMRVTKGDHVRAGDVLAAVDLAAVAAEGFATSTVLVVTGWKATKGVALAATGLVTSDDVILTVVV